MIQVVIGKRVVEIDETAPHSCLGPAHGALLEAARVSASLWGQQYCISERRFCLLNRGLRGGSFDGLVVGTARDGRRVDDAVLIHKVGGLFRTMFALRSESQAATATPPARGRLLSFVGVSVPDFPVQPLPFEFRTNLIHFADELAPAGAAGHRRPTAVVDGVGILLGGAGRRGAQSLLEGSGNVVVFGDSTGHTQARLVAQ